jgi:hypothetical protein
MRKNMGNTDKAVRILLAIIIAALYFTGTLPGVLGLVLLAFAAIFVLTSFISFCPLYLPFGINTCKKA